MSATSLGWTALHADLILAYAGYKEVRDDVDPHNMALANQDLIDFGFVSAKDAIPTDLCFATALAIRSFTRREVALATGAAAEIGQKGYIA